MSNSFWLRWNIFTDTLGAFFNIAFASFYSSLSIRQYDLSGKTAIITGANAGLGYCLALSLAQQNATVYLACRSRSKGEAAASKIIEATGSRNVHVVELDISSMKSVRAFTASWNKPIDILMHNAGIATSPQQGVRTTEEGLGLMYATNLIGSFLMTSLIEEQLTSKARVIFTSSTGAYGGRVKDFFTEYKSRVESLVYSDTKLMQVVLARALQNRWNSRGEQKIAQAWTPGFALTEIFGKMSDEANKKDFLWRSLKGWISLSISAEQGAMTGVYVATSEDAKALKGGQFWDRCRTRATVVDTLSQKEIDTIWQQWVQDSGAEWN